MSLIAVGIVLTRNSSVCVRCGICKVVYDVRYTNNKSHTAIPCAVTDEDATTAKVPVLDPTVAAVAPLTPPAAADVPFATNVVALEAASIVICCVMAYGCCRLCCICSQSGLLLFVVLYQVSSINNLFKRTPLLSFVPLERQFPNLTIKV